MPTKTIEIKPEDLSPMIVMLVIASIFCWIIVVVLFLGMISKPSEIKNLWFLWLVVVGFAFFLSNHAIWELVGKVKITINSDRLQIKNVNTIFKKELSIPLTDIRRVEYKKEETIHFFWLYGIVSGDIVIKYKNGQRRIGRGLSKNKSMIIISTLENEIQKRKMEA
jgi:hypothetical protein